MSESNDQDLLDESADRAIAARLGRLRSMPVDLTRLKASIEREIPRPAVQLSRKRFEWLSPLRAIAATFLIAAIATIAVVIATAGRPALASADEMAAVHLRMRSMSTTVASLDEAEKVLRSQWPQQPGLPSDLPADDDKPMSCCIHKLDGKRMSCVAVDLAGSRVSIAIGRADDFKIPPGSRRTINDHEYVIETAQGVNMVMTKRAGRWMCVMSSLPVDDLVAFTEKVIW